MWAFSQNCFRSVTLWFQWTQLITNPGTFWFQVCCHTKNVILTQWQDLINQCWSTRPNTWLCTVNSSTLELSPGWSQSVQGYGPSWRMRACPMRMHHTMLQKASWWLCQCLMALFWMSQSGPNQVIWPRIPMTSYCKLQQHLQESLAPVESPKEKDWRHCAHLGSLETDGSIWWKLSWVRVPNTMTLRSYSLKRLAPVTTEVW